MTLSTTSPRSPTYTGTGSNTTFPTVFQFASASEVRPVIINSDGTETIMTTGYTVNGAGTLSGSVTLASPLASGVKLYLRRTTNTGQPVSVKNLGQFNPRVHEEAWDRLAMQIQEMSYGVLRVQWSAGAQALEFPPPESSKLIGWNVAGTSLRNIDPTGPGDLLLRSDLADPTGGAGLVAFRQSVPGAALRTLADKAAESISVKDFGAVGDGVADDTDAIQRAVTYARTSGKQLNIPAGTYNLSASIKAGRIYPNEQLRIIGDGADSTKLKATPALSGAVLEVGDEFVAGYSGSVWMQDFAIMGAGPGFTGRGLQTWGVVHADFNRILISGCDIGFENRGGIDIDFSGCFAYMNGIGFNIDSWPVAGTTSYPNITNLSRCEIKDNTGWGVRFDNGRMLNITDSDIETNGTAGDAGTGGVFVGPGVNSETPGVDGQGLTIERTWLEANAGGAALMFESGVNVIRSCKIVGNHDATHDVRVKGGNYHVLQSTIAPFKPVNVMEDNVPAVKIGNAITDTYGGTYSYDHAKTQRLSAPYAVKSAGGLTGLAIQMGFVSGGSGPMTVSFPEPFAAEALVGVFTQIVNSSSTTIDQVECYSVSPSGFTMQRKSVAIPPASSISMAGTYSVAWLAVGQME